MTDEEVYARIDNLDYATVVRDWLTPPGNSYERRTLTNDAAHAKSEMLSWCTASARRKAKAR